MDTTTVAASTLSIADWIKLVTLLAGFATTIGISLYKFGKLEGRIGRLGDGIAMLNEWSRTMRQEMGLVKGDLIKSRTLSPDVLARIEEQPDIHNAMFNSIDKVVQGNPITIDESERLRRYLALIDMHQEFKPDEARDFYTLAQRVYNENPDKGSVWLLSLSTDIAAVYDIPDASIKEEQDTESIADSSD